MRKIKKPFVLIAVLLAAAVLIGIALGSGVLKKTPALEKTGISKAPTAASEVPLLPEETTDPEPEEETELFEEPCSPEDDTPADPVPAEDAAPEAEEDVCEQPGDDTPAEDVPEEPAASAAEGAPTKRRTVEIRRHERI